MERRGAKRPRALSSGDVAGFVGVGLPAARAMRGAGSCTRRAVITAAGSDNSVGSAVRRLLLVAGMTGSAALATQYWVKYGMEVIDKFTNEGVSGVRIQANLPLDPAVTNMAVEVLTQVATSKLRLLEPAVLADAAARQRKKASPFFLKEGQEELDELAQLNLDLYALCHVVAESTPLKAARAEYTMTVGSEIYKRLRQSSPRLAQDERASRANPRDPEPVLDGLRAIFGSFVQAGFVSGYRIDLLPDEETLWRDDGKCNFSTGIDDLATMAAAQLLAGEEYEDTAPTIIPYVVLAYLRACGLQVSYEDFYIDNTYQSNPANYRPTGVVSTYDIQVA